MGVSRKLQAIKPAADRSLACYFFADFLAFFFFAMTTFLEVSVLCFGKGGFSRPMPLAVRHPGTRDLLSQEAKWKNM